MRSTALVALVVLVHTLEASNQPPLRVRADVQAALDAGRPVVALESTIISHGSARSLIHQNPPCARAYPVC